jgi:ornithine cyclodeaminase/alanine dehydrogenase-like protein (mu-crystallin family)
MRVITAADIDAALTFPALTDALQAAFTGDFVVPVRHHHEIARPDSHATLLLMPAWSGKDAARPWLGTKIVTVYPANATRSLPSVMGTYLLSDGATGQPLAALDGARLTLWRTACASALAARYLARSDASHLLMVGAGALSPFMIRAHMAARPIRTVEVWNRNPAGAAALVASLAAMGITAQASDDLEASVRRADIVTCATLSTTPLVRGDWLKPGAHLDMVGAFTLGMREADDAALTRARVHVDTRAALSEGGDVAVAIKAGAYAKDSVAGDLFQLARGTVAGRGSPDEITLFKSVGTAIEDLAAAVQVWETVSKV